MHLYCDCNCAVLNCSCIMLSCFGSLCSHVPILGVHNWYLTPSLCECIQTMTVPSSYYNIRKATNNKLGKERERERKRKSRGSQYRCSLYRTASTLGAGTSTSLTGGESRGLHLHKKNIGTP